MLNEIENFIDQGKNLSKEKFRELKDLIKK